MGRRQVVRHRILIPTFGGSNPSAPVNILNYNKATIKAGLYVKSTLLINQIDLRKRKQLFICFRDSDLFCLTEPGDARVGCSLYKNDVLAKPKRLRRWQYLLKVYFCSVSLSMRSFT